MAKNLTISFSKNGTVSTFTLTENEQYALRSMWVVSKKNGHTHGMVSEMFGLKTGDRNAKVARMATLGFVTHEHSGDGTGVFTFTEEGRSLFNAFNDMSDFKKDGSMIEFTPKTKSKIPANACQACEGTGKDSTGRGCYPCNGSGKATESKVAAATASPAKRGPKPKAKKEDEAPAKRGPKPKVKEEKAAPTKKAPKAQGEPSSNGHSGGRTKKEGLRNPQIKILGLLLKANKPLNRKTIVEKTGLDTAWMATWIGGNDPEKRAASDEKYFPSLISLGLVKPEKHDVDGKDVICYSLTSAGKKKAQEA